MDSTHGEWTHVTNHEGLLVHHSPVLVMKFRTALWIHTRRTVIIRNLVKVPKPIRKKVKKQKEVKQNKNIIDVLAPLNIHNLQKPNFESDLLI